MNCEEQGDQEGAGGLNPEQAAFFQLLDQIEEEQEVLRSILLGEKQALREMKKTVLEETLLLKQASLDRLDRLEAERLKALVPFALHLRVPLKELTFFRLIAAWEQPYPKESAQLKQKGQRLFENMQGLVQQNRENKILIENFLIHIDKMKKNLIQDVEKLSCTYTAQGGRAYASSSLSSHFGVSI